MCGVFGALGRPGAVARETGGDATRPLGHRGPDSERCWLSADARVGLGHARLSIIDLEGGQQPLENEDGTIRAVVNGEIYDFERIQRGLKAKGHELSTRSDSEVL